MSLFFDSIFSSVAFGHFIVDVLNGQRAVLLAYQSGPLGLSNAQLGLISTLYIMAGSLSQPVFGFLTDRFGARWVAAGGVLTIGAFFSLALVTDGPAALIFLMLASLGSGSFHPAGTMQATLRGRTFLTGRETTSTAYFFFFGQAGAFIGPIIGGPLLDRFGPAGLLLLTSFTLPVGLNAARQLRFSRVKNEPGPANRPAWNLGNPVRQKLSDRLEHISLNRYGLLLAFGLLAAFQAWAQQNMVTFLPKYLADWGLSATAYGLAVSLFYGGSAVGTAMGGLLADRFGKRRVVVVALALASIPIYLTSQASSLGWIYLLAGIAGLLTGSVYSIIIVLAQRHIPGGMALASGLILGFMFSSGALGTFFSGYLADIWGFPPMFQMTAGITLAASILAITLKETSSGKTATALA
jgi:FSR family fosmidomycin resistance protein-like MFS transporter